MILNIGKLVSFFCIIVAIFVFVKSYNSCDETTTFNKINCTVLNKTSILTYLGIFLIYKVEKGQLGDWIIDNFTMNEEKGSFISSLAILTPSVLFVLIIICSSVLLMYSIINISNLIIYFFSTHISLTNSLPSSYCNPWNVPRCSTEQFANRSDLIESFENTTGEKLKFNSGNSAPISFYNEKTKKQQDLILADFMYPASYNSLISGTGNKAIIDIKLLKKLLFPANTDINGYGMRALHFQIGQTEGANSTPIVTSKDGIYSGLTPVDFQLCMQHVNNLAWKHPYDPVSPLPLFIYLDLLFPPSELNIYRNISSTLENVFQYRLISKKYGYNGRSGLHSVSQAPIKEAFGKVIIITNRFPTHSPLDSHINLSTSDTGQCSLITYDKEFHNYDTGLGTANNKSDLLLKTNEKFRFC